MADKPILFSAPMIRALLEGRKTQTRRVLKPQPQPFDALFSENGKYWTGDAETGEVDEVLKTKCAIGDRLWVKETWADAGTHIRYYATDAVNDLRKKRPSIFMPRWASRITLTVTDVRVQRLQDISGEDAIAEGLIQNPNVSALAIEMGCNWGFEGDCRHGSPVSAYAALWNTINGEGAWAVNPWVAAYTFTVRLGNIDQVGA